MATQNEREGRMADPNGRMIVGLDGSLTAFGWSVLTLEDTPQVLQVGCICTKPDTKSVHQYAADKDGARVDTIAAELYAVLWSIKETGHPFLVCIEAPAGAQHAASAKALGLSYGISRALCVAVRTVPITVQAHEVKKVCGGSMGASKDDVAKGVHRLTGWSSKAKTKDAREGESDAVGVALTGMRHPIAAMLRTSLR